MRDNGSSIADSFSRIQVVSILVVGVLWLSYCLPQLWIYQKYAGLIGILLSLSYGTLIFAFATFASGLSQVRSRLVLFSSFAIIGLSVIALWLLYPLADQRAANGFGSDTDDAIRIGTERLLAGLNPYAELTYLDGPITPLPGVFLLYSPAHVLLGQVVWMAPVLLAVSLFFLGKASSRALCGVLIAVAASPLFWWSYVTGGEFILLGMMAFGLASYIVVTRDRRLVILSAILLGIVCTSRPTMLLFICALLVIEILLGRTKRGCVLVITVLGVSAALTLPVYLWDPQQFTPLHVADKAGGTAIGVSAVTLVLAWQGAVYLVLRTRMAAQRDPIGAFALIVGPGGFLLVLLPALIQSSPYLLHYAAFTSMCCPLAATFLLKHFARWPLQG